MWFTEMVSYARPRIPSNLGKRKYQFMAAIQRLTYLPKANVSPGSLVASAKS